MEHSTVAPKCQPGTVILKKGRYADNQLDGAETMTPLTPFILPGGWQYHHHLGTWASATFPGNHPIEIAAHVTECVQGQLGVQH